MDGYGHVFCMYTQQFPHQLQRFTRNKPYQLDFLPSELLHPLEERQQLPVRGELLCGAEAMAMVGQRAPPGHVGLGPW